MTHAMEEWLLSGLSGPSSAMTTSRASGTSSRPASPLNFVLHLCIILLILSYYLQLFTLFLTTYLLRILYKPLLNTLSHANSLQLNPFYIFSTPVSSPRYLPSYPFVIRAFRSTYAHSSYIHTLSTDAEDSFASLNSLLR